MILIGFRRSDVMWRSDFTRCVVVDFCSVRLLWRCVALCISHCAWLSWHRCRLLYQCAVSSFVNVHKNSLENNWDSSNIFKKKSKLSLNVKACFTICSRRIYLHLVALSSLVFIKFQTTRLDASNKCMLRHFNLPPPLQDFR